MRSQRVRPLERSPARLLGLLLFLGAQGCGCFAPVDERDAGSDGSSDGGSASSSDGGDGGAPPQSDGGIATRPCPLTDGVCTGAVSRLVNGQWSTCDYGPDYELTERRCDGLDNDCDGRVDVSWARAVLGPSDGRYWPRLTAEDGERAQITAVDGGYWVSLPNDLLILDPNLQVVRRTKFPMSGQAIAHIFRTPEGWIRFVYDYRPSGPVCVHAHRVAESGDFPTAPDGGAELLWSSCATSLAPFLYSFAAAEVDGGWMTLIKDAETSSDTVFRWTWSGRDGGVAEGTFDAGALPLGGTYVREGSAAALIAVEDQAASRILRVTAPAAAPVPVFDESTGFCEMASDDPFTVACRATVGGVVLTTWKTAGGALLTPPFDGYPVYAVGRRGSPLAMRRWYPIIDGGSVSMPIGDLAAVLDGGELRTVARLGPLTIRYLVRAADVGGGASLLFWGDFPPDGQRGFCPNCDVQSFSVGYVCVP